MTGIEAQEQRDQALDIFKQMYGQAIGTGPVMEYLSQDRTGRADWRGHPEDPSLTSTSPRSSTRTTQSRRACATWREFIPRTSARASSTLSTADTTPTPTNCRRIPSWSATCPARYMTSSPTWKNTTRTTTLSCWVFTEFGRPHLRQRLRHRPRFGRRRVPRWQACRGRTVLRVPVAGSQPVGEGRRPGAHD